VLRCTARRSAQRAAGRTGCREASAGRRRSSLQEWLACSALVGLCERRSLCEGSRPVRSGVRRCPALQHTGIALLLLSHLPASRKLCGKQVAYAGA